MGSRRAFSTWALCVLAGLVGPAAAAASVEHKPWEDYEVLVRRNMFSRQRSPRSVEGPVRPEVVTVEAPSPERYVLLRGVVRSGDEFIAFLEDMRTGEVIRARAGDEVVRGRVAEVTLDGVRYVREDTETEVPIGENLEKSNVSPAAQAAGEATGSGEQAIVAPETGPAADLLERLRQRRQEELGQ